jgi:mitogen-activated protein kinase kinase
MGKYPYPPETYSNVFAQLTAIVHGPPPSLPAGFTKEANDFVEKWYGWRNTINFLSY